MISVMVLGAGVMQMPALRIARRLGWRVVAADGNPDAIGRNLCDSFAHVDLKDLDGLLAIARSESAAAGLNGVFTAGTDFSTSVAYLSEKLGLPGIPFEVARRATDKCLMRESFARAEAPSPRFSCWTGVGSPKEAIAGLSFPLVAKPVDNMGARGVQRVNGPADLEAACRAALALSRSSRVIIEEYMEGPELSLDAVVYDGTIAVCGVADRHIRFPPHFVEMGHTMPTELDETAVKEVEECFRKGIRALGLSRGAAKGDIKLTPKGPMIGEIAARLSGGYMSGWTYPFSSGVEVTEAALKIAVGLAPGDLAPLHSKTSAERAFISVPGTIAAIEGVDDSRKTPGVAEVFLRVKPGDSVAFPKNNVEKCGNVISVHENRGQAVSAARDAVACILLRLEPLSEETTRFLFGTGRNALSLQHEETRRALASMPPCSGDPSLASGKGALCVRAIPGIEQEAATDWHDIPLRSVIRRVTSACDIRFVGPGATHGFVVGNLFWRALLRGSVQGGVYIVDSIRQAAAFGRARELMDGLAKAVAG